MKNSQSLEQHLAQRQTLSQLQLRYVKLLELNTPELEEAVERELVDNPALEADSPASPDEVMIQAAKPSDADATHLYYNPQRNHDADHNLPFSPPDNSETLLDYLQMQLAERPLPEDVARVAQYLVGNVDSNGYIRRPLHNIIEDMDFNHSMTVNPDVAARALEVVKSLDPAGVGAADLRESLKLQLERLPESDVRNAALAIISDCFDEFTMKHYHRIQSKLKLSKNLTEEAITLILTLNPKPGASFASYNEVATQVIIPDFIVQNRDDELFISLNSHLPELSIEESFAEAVDNLNRSASGRRSRKGNEYIISRYNDARDFIKILRQRQKTMISVMTAIVEIQKDYFLTEDVDNMRPMMIKDIAARTGLDLSTISRATNNKYVATDWGVFPLRHFFSDTIGNEGEKEGITNRRIEAEIERLVSAEDKKHPLSDEKLCERLREMGYDVSRRTVAKYRDRKKIPVARLRKGL